MTYGKWPMRQLSKGIIQVSCHFRYLLDFRFFNAPHFILDFFIGLDHENGPITLHSSLSKVVKYVHAGLQKLKQM